MGNLQTLEELQLSRNRLNGSIPASIFNISALRVFGCVGSNLLGSLPASLGKGLSNLQELYLGINSFSGFIPDSISNASKLTILDLSTNSFTGPIPDSLGNLEFLEILALGENRFMSPSSNAELSILNSLTNCRHLDFVDLTTNQLGGKLPTSIGNFSDSLQVFRAGLCGIKGNLPQEIGNLSNLAELNLVYNELSGNVPRTIVGLQKIQQLYLQNNTFTGFIPNEICSMKNLGALRLSLNQISGSLPACVENMTFLRYLHLDSNRLSSSIPTGIWKLNDIIEFNASSNMLYGNLPLEIGNLKVATLVDLSMNNLSGNIPTTVGGLQNLIRFSLAHNRLEEHIPDSFGEILSLEYLDISNNNLNGKIPQSLEKLSHLTYFNVSFNNLDGEIPNGGPFVNFTEQSFMHNRALCGASRFHVSPCRPSSRKKPRKNRALHIALYTILAFGAITIALVGLVVLRWRKRRKIAMDQTPALPPQASHERISFDELEVATEGFSESNLLGTGGFGSVYKGTLKDGVQVAVKVFNTQLEGAFRSFDTECEVLRSLRHRNLTKVISSCTNLDTRVLVLEYMPNGSLEKWLYSHNYFLDILQRLNIMIDVVCALDYLHNGNLVAVVHCDLKPSNILLDDELVGHVTDFGISKILEAGNSIVRTKTLATIGYIAPEYGLEGVVSTKSDIYSYGILLIETFTRTKPSDDMFARSELSLRQWVKNSQLPSDITRIVDSNLLKEGKESLDAKIECLLSIMDLALKCTEEVPALRITVKDVVTTLNKIKIQLLSTC